MNIIELVRKCAESNNLNLPHNDDGRLQSALAENPYLMKMKEWFQLNHPGIPFEIPPQRSRYWCDFMVACVPINLKLTTGGRDNACNKRMIIHTICGTIDGVPSCMNFNDMVGHIDRLGIRKGRNPLREYHYLVVDKTTGRSMCKSILDIHTYISNPSNTLQFNWKHEFEHEDYTCESYIEKMDQLMQTIQESEASARNNSTLLLTWASPSHAAKTIQARWRGGRGRGRHAARCLSGVPGTGVGLQDDS